MEDERQEEGGDGVTSGVIVTSGDDVVTSSDGGIITGDGGVIAGYTKSSSDLCSIHIADETTKGDDHFTVCTEATAVVAGAEDKTHASSVQEGNSTSAACSSSREAQSSSSASKDTVLEVLAACVNHSTIMLLFFQAVCVDDYSTAEELEAVGAERLKAALQTMGLKCGGTVKERAQRLFSTKGKKLDQLDRTLFAKPTKQQK